jgi:hypothetical protein
LSDFDHLSRYGPAVLDRPPCKSGTQNTATTPLWPSCWKITKRHYGNTVPDGAGAAGAAFLVDPPPGGTLCLVAEGNDGLVGFAILNPYSRRPT